MATIVEQLAQLSTQVEFDQLPRDVVHQAKRKILDSLACAMGGYSSEPSQAMCRIAKQVGGNPEATVWGSGDKTTSLLATLANGTMLRYLDYNDYYFGRDPSHPSGNVAPVIASAESRHLGGKEVISSLVLAYEIQLRLASYAGEPNLWLRGWDHATNVPYAAAAACGYLAGLKPSAVAHAMAIAGIQGNTLSEIRRGVIPMQKAFAEAKAASDGLLASLLAEQGMTGTLTVFEGDYGYINVVAGECDVESLTAPEMEYAILRGCLKYFPVEAMTQAPVQAAILLRDKHRIRGGDIAKVAISLYDFAYEKPSWDETKLNPTTRESADHSFTYCVAVALLDGAVGPEQFTEDRIRSADVRAIMSRTTLEVEEEFNQLYPSTLPGAVTVVLEDGTTLHERVDYPIGHPRNRVSEADLEDKFLRLSRDVLSDRQAQQLVACVRNLEDVSDIREMTELLTV